MIFKQNCLSNIKALEAFLLDLQYGIIKKFKKFIHEYDD